MTSASERCRPAPGAPGGDERADDAAPVGLLAKVADGPREHLLGRRLEPQPGRHAGARSILMSAGPSARNEKPRPGSSSWKEETPKSKRIPSKSARQMPPSLPKSRSIQREPPGKFGRQLRRAGRLRIPVQRNDMDTVRRLEDGAGVPPSAEGAVEEAAAGPAQETQTSRRRTGWWPGVMLAPAKSGSASRMNGGASRSWRLPATRRRTRLSRTRGMTQAVARAKTRRVDPGGIRVGDLRSKRPCFMSVRAEDIFAVWFMFRFRGGA
jgi:hypothetical protein